MHAPTHTHARTHTPQNATHARTYQRRRRRVHRRPALPTNATTLASSPLTPAAPLLLLLLAGGEPLLELPHPHPQPQRAPPRLGRLGRRLPSVRYAVGFVWLCAGLVGGSWKNIHINQEIGGSPPALGSFCGGVCLVVCRVGGGQLEKQTHKPGNRSIPPTPLPQSPNPEHTHTGSCTPWPPPSPPWPCAPPLSSLAWPGQSPPGSPPPCCWTPRAAAAPRRRGPPWLGGLWGWMKGRGSGLCGGAATRHEHGPNQTPPSPPKHQKTMHPIRFPFPLPAPSLRSLTFGRLRRRGRRAGLQALELPEGCNAGGWVHG